MRIVLTVPSLRREFGGPTGKARDLAGALRSLGHEAVVVGAGSSDEPAVRSLGSRGAFHATPIPATTLPLRRLVGGADVVHVIGYRDPVGTAAALAARRHRVPFVLEPVGMLERRVRSFALKGAFDATLGSWVVRRAASIVAASSVEASDLARAGVESTRIRIRPNGVDFDDLLPLPPRGPLRQQLGIPQGVPLVLTLARIGLIKGLDTMARALGSMPDAWWLLAGPDEHDGALDAVRAALDAVGATDRAIVCTEGLWGDDKRAAMAEADAFCLPSVYESFGTAALEAAGIDLPVVVTEGCGAKDVLDPATSRVVPSRSPEALAGALEELLGIDGAGEYLRARLDWRSLAEGQVAIYAEVAPAR